MKLNSCHAIRMQSSAIGNVTTQIRKENMNINNYFMAAVYSVVIFLIVLQKADLCVIIGICRK